jgi:hypothetical protein
MSTLHCNTVETSSGGAVTLTNQSATKGWLRYNQQTPAITDSFNISSVTDSSSGLFVANLSSAMSDGNYPCTVSAASLYTNNRPFIMGGASSDGTWTSSAVEMTTTYYENTMQDSPRACIAFHGDLA